MTLANDHSEPADLFLAPWSPSALVSNSPPSPPTQHVARTATRAAARARVAHAAAPAVPWSSSALRNGVAPPSRGPASLWPA